MNYSYQFIVFLFICLVILLFSFLSFLNHMSSYIYIYIYVYLYICMCIVISEFYYRYTNFFMLLYFQVVFKIAYMSRKTDKKPKTKKRRSDRYSCEQKKLGLFCFSDSLLLRSLAPAILCSSEEENIDDL